MAKRLSRVLVENRIVDVATMERAFRHKDVAGGRLGTNLLEIGAIDDEALQFALSVSRDLPSPSEALLANLDPSGINYISVDDAVNFGVLPAAVRGDKLIVLVKDPLSEERREVLEKRSGYSLVPHIIADFRFEQLLSLLYGLPLSSRLQALCKRFPASVALVEFTPQAEPTGVAGPTDIGEPEQPIELVAEPRRAAEIDETGQAETAFVSEGFDAIVEMVEAEAALESDQFELSIAEEVPAEKELEEGWAPLEEEELIEEEPAARVEEALAVEEEPEEPAARVEEALAVEEEPEEPAARVEEALAVDQEPEEPAARVEEALAVEEEPEEPRVPVDLARPGVGWTIEQLGHFLEGCDDRDVILKSLKGFIGNHCPRRCLMAVRKGDLKGLDQEGFGESSDDLRRLRLDGAMVLNRMQDEWGPTAAIGTPHELGLVPLYRTYELVPPSELVVGLIRIQHHPVLVWIADNEVHPIPRTSLLNLEKATGQVASALARLIYRKKRTDRQTLPSEPAETGEREGEPTAREAGSTERSRMTLRPGDGLVDWAAARPRAETARRPSDVSWPERERPKPPSKSELATTKPEIPRRLLAGEWSKSVSKGGERGAEKGMPATPPIDEQALIDTDRKARRLDIQTAQRHIEATPAAPLVHPSPFTTEELEHIEEQPLGSTQTGEAAVAPLDVLEDTAPVKVMPIVHPPSGDSESATLQAKPYEVMRSEAAQRDVEGQVAEPPAGQPLTGPEQKDRELFGEIEQFLLHQEVKLTPSSVASEPSDMDSFASLGQDTLEEPVEPEQTALDIDRPSESFDGWTDEDILLEPRERTLPGLAGVPRETRPVQAVHAAVTADEALPYIYPTPVKLDVREIAARGGSVPRPGEGGEPHPSEAPEFPSAVEIIDGLLSQDESIALHARAELLLAGEAALDELEARFPGPVHAEPGLPNSPVFAAQYGPIMATVIDLGPRFVPRIIQLMRSKRRDQRLYATLCCRDLLHTRLLRPLIERTFDADPLIRKIACDSLESYRSHDQFREVWTTLRSGLMEANPNRQAAAAEALSSLFDEESIPYLIELVGSRSARVASAAITALERMTFQSFGTDKRRWLKWYSRHAMQSRHEWLIDSVGHRDQRIRALVSEYLKKTPDLDLEFDPTAGRREQKRVQNALREHFKLDTGPFS